MPTSTAMISPNTMPRSWTRSRSCSGRWPRPGCFGTCCLPEGPADAHDANRAANILPSLPGSARPGPCSSGTSALRTRGRPCPPRGRTRPGCIPRTCWTCPTDRPGSSRTWRRTTHHHGHRDPAMFPSPTVALRAAVSAWKWFTSPSLPSTRMVSGWSPSTMFRSAGSSPTFSYLPHGVHRHPEQPTPGTRK